VTCPKGLGWPPRAGPWLALDGHALLVRAPLGPGDRPSRVAVRASGQPSLSVVEPPQPRGPGQARVALALHTGRRHQARVHLAWLGLPIVGDELYGGAAAERVHLHALSLDLRAIDPDGEVVIAVPSEALA